MGTAVLTQPLTVGDAERIRFRVPDNSPPYTFGTGRVMFTARAQSFFGPVVLEKRSTNPGDFHWDAETDDNGVVWHHVRIGETDLDVPEMTDVRSLACDIVLENAEGEDSTTKFYASVERRATPVG